jgi:hypothetical protein
MIGLSKGVAMRAAVVHPALHLRPSRNAAFNSRDNLPLLKDLYETVAQDQWIWSRETRNISQDGPLLPTPFLSSVQVLSCKNR